ncbi:MAG TPA: DUF5683 domain-containing protein [Ignavibacteria bacterium]|jgi:TM2 domain-containing membrane protein YozV
MTKQFLKGAFLIFMIVPFFILRAQSRLGDPPIQTGNSPGNDIVLSLHDSHKITSNSHLLNLNSVTDSLTPSKDSLPKTTKKFRMRKSPLLAVLLSMVIPGAGQLYNGSYWKIPIIDGLIGYFGYEYINNNNKFKDYRDQYNATITPENPFGDQNLKTLREFYRSQRDDFVWYFIIVYTINLIDAYVDAHLFDFDVKEEKLTQYGKSDKTYRLKINLEF